MVNYYYDVGSESFKREDNRGKGLYVNITEAQRIVNLLDLGHSLTEVEGKVTLSNPKGTSTTIKSFIKNYKNGNIEMPIDAPAPVRVFEELSDSSRIDELEERVSALEEIFAKPKKTRFEKVKSWMHKYEV